MKASITTETLSLENNRDVVLVCASGGSGNFGICDTTRDRARGIKETFFVGQEAVINVLQKSVNDPYSNKVIWQSSSIDKTGDFQKRIAMAVDELYLNGKSIPYALSEVLANLKNGLYAVYQADMIPTDGAGNYFWNAYMVGHELNGSSTYSSVCCKRRNLSPAFLVPTEPISAYNDKLLKTAMDKYKDDTFCGGLAFHLTGMFCALLSDHHVATAAMMNGQKFRCTVIEPLRYVFFKDEVEQEEGRPEIERCDYIYSHYVKIPIYKIPQNMLEDFFATRRTDEPKYYDTIRINSERLTRLKGKRAFAANLVEKCERQPDAEMLQSAAFVDNLTDTDLEALLNGEIAINDRIIINTNYYSSVCIACNYLQYTNFNRFLDFTLSVMHNENLAAVHQFVANRLMSVIEEPVKSMFIEIKDSDNPVYEVIKPIAEKYIKRYDSIAAKKAKQEETSKRIESTNVATLKRNTGQEIDALQMAKLVNNAQRQR